MGDKREKPKVNRVYRYCIGITSIALIIVVAAVIIYKIEYKMLISVNRTANVNSSNATSVSNTVSSSKAASGTSVTPPETNSVWDKSADLTTGYDWNSMTKTQKLSLINKVINSWNQMGTSIGEPADSFMAGVDSFYKDSRASILSDNVADIMNTINDASNGGNNVSSDGVTQSGLTLAKFTQINSTFTVQDVNKLFGVDGALDSEAGQGTDFHLEIYSWQDPDTNAIVTITFQNGFENAKDQIGLS